MWSFNSAEERDNIDFTDVRQLRVQVGTTYFFGIISNKMSFYRNINQFYKDSAPWG